jgi:Predicted AAA-ATPase/PD-(D/E)XK nuclease superfamily
MMKLPIGLQDFRKLIEDGFLYVDKTKHIHRLVTSGSYYFLSRPRRFGKSLTLSTIKELFSGSRELFEGLWVVKHWDWEKTFPVLHIHFDSRGYKDKGIPNAISDFLHQEAHKHQLKLAEQFPGSQFKELIEKLHEKYGEQVVILIDEYDKPIIDYMEELEKAKAQRDELKGFYSVIKSSDAYIRFLLITGVSKFSKVSIFSELNNLDDITIDRRFSSMLGYTQEELEHYFQDRMAQSRQQLQVGQKELLNQIKQWYNGYSWDGKNYVYNPFSILNFFSKNTFLNFWFATGTPTFLIKLLKNRQQIDLENVEVDQSVFESYNLDNLETLSLLFQTGYSTIKSIGEFDIYTLGYPNKEVKESMLRHLIGEFRHDSPALTTPIVIKLRKAFLDNDIERVIVLINGLFKSIPSPIFIKEKEAYYHSVVFLVFQYLGQFIEAEVHTSDGRIDAVVHTETHIYLLEFKLDRSAAEAMQQIREKAYADKYRLQEKVLTGIGINFSSKTKNVEDWETEGFRNGKTTDLGG